MVVAMRYHFPIAVDIYDFLYTGRFDYLEIGQSAESILQMFPAPDCVPKGLLVQKGWNIWLYGDIELHFSDNRLTQIRADFQPDAALSGGRWVKLNPWFFANGCLDVYAVIQRLVQRNIDFIKTETHTNLILQLQSGVELIFENAGVCNLPRSANKKPPCPTGHEKRLLK